MYLETWMHVFLIINWYFTFYISFKLRGQIIVEEEAVQGFLRSILILALSLDTVLSQHIIS